MSYKILRRWTIIIGLVTLLGAVFLAPLAFVQAQEPLGTIFTYQGFLHDEGLPAGGDYDFEFQLYNAESGGSQIGSTYSVPSVDVIDGYFAIELDFGGDTFNGEARWLEVFVQASGSPEPPTKLSPRVRLTLSPYALFSQKLGLPFTGHSHCLNVFTCGPGFEIINSGLGQAGRFEISGSTNNSTALEAMTSGTGLAGLFAIENQENSGVALVGRTNGISGTGIFGYARAITGTTFGLHGEVDSSRGKGVYGLNTHHNSEGYLGGVDVQGDPFNALKIGVGAYGFAYDGYGVYARSVEGSGVYGVSFFGD